MKKKTTTMMWTAIVTYEAMKMLNLTFFEMDLPYLAGSPTIVMM